MSDPVENTPDVWDASLPIPKPDGHKYDRGHAVIFAAPDLTGATRLAAEACSRIGAGLVTVLAWQRADIYRATLPADIMVSEQEIEALRKPSVVLAGSGGMTDRQRDAFDAWSAQGDCVADAGAIKDFSTKDGASTCVLTPHEGEFAEAFPELKGTREERALEAARQMKTIIVLKGSETMIVAPDGQLVINRHASPYLAKAGTGDVLAGMVTGLIAQSMPPFEASCAAVWMHGEAGLRLGPGLVAGDLAGQIPSILHDLLPQPSTG